MPNSDNFEVTVDLPKNSTVLRDLGGDSKTLKVVEEAFAAGPEAAQELAERLTKRIQERGERVAPSRDTFREDALRDWREVSEEREKRVARLVSWLEKRAKKAQEELPNLTDGPADPAESDIRRFVREADGPKERQSRINTVVEQGGEAALRALFRESVPPAVAGFPTEEMRERKLHETLRAADEDAFETWSSVSTEIGRIEQDAARFELAAERAVRSAIQRFDEMVDGG